MTFNFLISPDFLPEADDPSDNTALDEISKTFILLG